MLAGVIDPNRVLADPAWPTLHRTLDRAQAAGVDPYRLLVDVAHARELASAENPAKVLRWRISRVLGGRPEPPRPPGPKKDEQLQLM